MIKPIRPGRVIQLLAFSLLIVFLLAGATGYAAALIKNGQVYFPNGVIPATPLTYDNSQEMRVVVVAVDAVLKDRPNGMGDNLTPTSVGSAPGYLDPLQVYAITEDEEFFLVRNPKNNQWGWIATDFVLFGFEPLRDEDITNPSFIKVVVKNNWRTDRAGSAKAAPILNGPGPRYDEIGKVDIFNIRYAYDIRTAADGNQYVLVGLDPELNLYNPSSNLTGWIRRDHTILWESRVGVYYDKATLRERTEPVAIFKTLDDLQQYNRTGKASQPIAMEDPKVTTPLPYYTTRFPVIDQNGGGGVRIAFVGDGYSQEINRLVSKEEISAVANRNNLIVDRLRSRDVLFLIDATDSMGPYFEAVSRGINRYLASISSEHEQQRYRFGLGIYRDYEDKEGFAIKVKIGSNVFRGLQKVVTGGGGDAQEAFYQGIVKGVEQANWNEGTTRAVVVIGDHGNHMMDYRYNAKQVATVLKDNRISFYSINLNCNQTEEHKFIFDKQVNNLLRMRGGVGKNFSLQVGGRDETLQTEDAIVAILHEIEGLSHDVSNALIDRLLGNNNDWGTQATQYLQEIMQETNLQGQGINLSMLNQICEDGWVSKKDRHGINQLEPWILMERTELEEMLGFMAGLYKLARRRIARGLGNAVKEITKNASGDEINERERISEYLQRRLHIPFREISDVLQYSPSQLEEKFRADAKFRERFVRTVGRKYVLLQSVAEEKTGRLVWNEQQQRWNKLDPREKKWWVITPGGSSYAWLPMQYLP